MNDQASISSLGYSLLCLVGEQASWSEAVFGSDQIRGPIGPLRHLEKEAREAQANPADPSEYADCLLLVLDASRRAGLSIERLLTEAHAKMLVNRSRKWPTPTSDQPVEHEREYEETKP